MSVAPGAAIGEQRPTIIRVTLPDGSQVRMSRPVIIGDSMVASTEANSTRTAVADVRRLEVQRFSVHRTVGLLVAHASIGLGVVAFIFHVQPHYRGLF
jgi:hypothetical protein